MARRKRYWVESVWRVTNQWVSCFGATLLHTHTHIHKCKVCKLIWCFGLTVDLSSPLLLLLLAVQLSTSASQPALTASEPAPRVQSAEGVVRVPESKAPAAEGSPTKKSQPVSEWSLITEYNQRNSDEYNKKKKELVEQNKRLLKYVVLPLHLFCFYVCFLCCYVRNPFSCRQPILTTRHALMHPPFSLPSTIFVFCLIIDHVLCVYEREGAERTTTGINWIRKRRKCGATRISLERKRKQTSNGPWMMLQPIVRPIPPLSLSLPPDLLCVACVLLAGLPLS
jgi:hypothetical protein